MVWRQHTSRHAWFGDNARHAYAYWPAPPLVCKWSGQQLLKRDSCVYSKLLSQDLVEIRELDRCLAPPDPLEAEDRPGRKLWRTLRSTPGGGQPQRGVPSTDDFGGPLGKGVLSATAESNTAVPVGPRRPSSITPPEAPATATSSYIVGWHRWNLGLGQFGAWINNDSRLLLWKPPERHTHMLLNNSSP